MILCVCLFKDSDVLSFNGQSSLIYRLTPRPRQMSSESISLKFKTLKNSGILLHAEGQNGHSLTLELEKGKLQLLIRKGTTLSFYSCSVETMLLFLLNKLKELTNILLVNY